MSSQTKSRRRSKPATAPIVETPVIEENQEPDNATETVTALATPEAQQRLAEASQQDAEQEAEKAKAESQSAETLKKIVSLASKGEKQYVNTNRELGQLCQEYIIQRIKAGHSRASAVKALDHEISLHTSGHNLSQLLSGSAVCQILTQGKPTSQPWRYFANLYSQFVHRVNADTVKEVWEFAKPELKEKVQALFTECESMKFGYKDMDAKLKEIEEDWRQDQLHEEQMKRAEIEAQRIALENEQKRIQEEIAAAQAEKAQKEAQAKAAAGEAKKQAEAAAKEAAAKLAQLQTQDSLNRKEIKTAIKTVNETDKTIKSVNGRLERLTGQRPDKNQDKDSQQPAGILQFQQAQPMDAAESLMHLLDTQRPKDYLFYVKTLGALVDLLDAKIRKDHPSVSLEPITAGIDKVFNALNKVK